MKICPTADKSSVPIKVPASLDLMHIYDRSMDKSIYQMYSMTDRIAKNLSTNQMYCDMTITIVVMKDPFCYKNI